MNRLELEQLHRIRDDFEQLKRAKGDLTKLQEGQLLSDVTNLIGWFIVDRGNRKLRLLIEDMISFGETKGEVMAGARISFENVKKQKIKIENK